MQKRNKRIGWRSDKEGQVLKKSQESKRDRYRKVTGSKKKTGENSVFFFNIIDTK